MSQQTKTDNKSLDAKVQLRLKVLGAAALGELRILDLCAGEGEIWRAMRRHVKLSSYVPVDQAPRQAGTLVGDITDMRFLAAFDLSRYNVMDVDTYGEPWVPWRFIFDRLAHKAAVFLTHGAVWSPGGANISKFVLENLGIPLDWQIPMKRDLTLFAAPYLLLSPSPTARIAQGWKVTLKNVTYYGLIVKPRKGHDVRHDKN